MTLKIVKYDSVNIELLALDDKDRQVRLDPFVGGCWDSADAISLIGKRVSISDDAHKDGLCYYPHFMMLL